MGQTLSEPITEKHTTAVVRGKRYTVGLSDMQGWRISMEDSHSVHLYLPPSGTNPSGPSTSTQPIPEQPAGSTVTNEYPEANGPAFFGVFDGHGGSSVAKFTGTTLHTRLSQLESYKAGKYEEALKEAFLKTDQDLRADPAFLKDPSGCTSVVVIATDDGRLICANAGDSRCVLGWKGEAKAMSNDHKPTDSAETARITAAGGFVEFARVNGNLALSRAIGDFEFKQNYGLDAESQIVTANPEIISHTIDGEEEFIVLACDGIWDVLSSQQVVDFVRRAIANGDNMSKIAEDVLTKCLAKESDTAGVGCDNMTVVVVGLLGERTPEEWQAWIKSRVEKKVGHDTPVSIPDPFANLPKQPGISLGALTGQSGGFRVGGSGGLANIASILNASGITFQSASDDSDDSDDDLQIVGDETSKEGSIEEVEDTAGASVADGYMDDQALDQDKKPKDVTDELDDLPTNSQSGSIRLVDEDGDSVMESEDSDDTTTEEKNKPTYTNEKQKQFKSQPGGDAKPAVSKVEGMLDGSEDPSRV